MYTQPRKWGIHSHQNNQMPGIFEKTKPFLQRKLQVQASAIRTNKMNKTECVTNEAEHVARATYSHAQRKKKSTQTVLRAFILLRYADQYTLTTCRSRMEANVKMKWKKPPDKWITTTQWIMRSLYRQTAEKIYQRHLQCFGDFGSVLKTKLYKFSRRQLKCP